MQKIKWPSEYLTNARSHARTKTRTHTDCGNIEKFKKQHTKNSVDAATHLFLHKHTCRHEGPRTPTYYFY